jgi:type IV pilus assembly protein PilA
MKRGVQVAFVLWLGLTCLICFTGSPPIIMFRLPFEVFLGWTLFLASVLPQVSPNPGAIAIFAVSLVLVTAGVHSFARWLRDGWRARSTFAFVGLFLLAFVAGISMVAVVHQSIWLATGPAIIQSSWRHGNEIAAIGGLKTIATSEGMFREGDKDENGKLDYGTLEQLSTTQLVDSILGSGTKQGYLFAAGPSVVSPETLWFGTAYPSLAELGERAFFVNQAGVIFYTTQGGWPRVDRATCEAPAGWLAVGR